MLATIFSGPSSGSRSSVSTPSCLQNTIQKLYDTRGCPEQTHVHDSKRVLTRMFPFFSPSRTCFRLNCMEQEDVEFGDLPDAVRQAFSRTAPQFPRSSFVPVSPFVTR